MEELERCGDWILDNQKLIIFNTVSGTALHFDFKNMCFKEAKKQSLKPIQYDPIKKEMKYWAQQRWTQFHNYQAVEAAHKLYDNYFEATFLGDDE